MSCKNVMLGRQVCDVEAAVGVDAIQFMQGGCFLSVISQQIAQVHLLAPVRNLHAVNEIRLQPTAAPQDAERQVQPGSRWLAIRIRAAERNGPKANPCDPAR